MPTDPTSRLFGAAVGSVGFVLRAPECCALVLVVVLAAGGAISRSDQLVPRMALRQAMSRRGGAV